jgi:hypothetical protein
LGQLRFWRDKRFHPHPLKQGEPEGKAGEEECQLLLPCFGDGSFGNERDSDRLCCSTSNQEEEELKEKFRKESKVRLKELRRKRACFCGAYC